MKKTELLKQLKKYDKVHAELTIKLHNEALKNGKLKDQVEAFQSALSVEHDHLYPKGQCYLCDTLRESFENQN